MLSVVCVTLTKLRDIRYDAKSVRSYFYLFRGEITSKALSRSQTSQGEVINYRFDCCHSLLRAVRRRLCCCSPYQQRLPVANLNHQIADRARVANSCSGKSVYPTPRVARGWCPLILSTVHQFFLTQKRSSVGVCEQLPPAHLSCGPHELFLQLLVRSGFGQVLCLAHALPLQETALCDICAPELRRCESRSRSARNFHCQ